MATQEQLIDICKKAIIFTRGNKINWDELSKDRLMASGLQILGRCQNKLIYISKKPKGNYLLEVEAKKGSLDSTDYLPLKKFGDYLFGKDL